MAPVRCPIARRRRPAEAERQLIVSRREHRVHHVIESVGGSIPDDLRVEAVHAGCDPRQGVQRAGADQRAG